MSATAQHVEWACEVMHDAYEAAAVGAGWETQAASRKPWADVPEANKATMRAAVGALLAALAQHAHAAPSDDQVQRVAEALWIAKLRRYYRDLPYNANHEWWVGMQKHGISDKYVASARVAIAALDLPAILAEAERRGREAALRETAASGEVTLRGGRVVTGRPSDRGPYYGCSRHGGLVEAGEVWCNDGCAPSPRPRRAGAGRAGSTICTSCLEGLHDECHRPSSTCGCTTNDEEAPRG